MISGDNVLEEIQVSLYVVPRNSCSAQSGDWPAFSAILTSPDAFPMLRRVSITIDWSARLNGDKKNVLETLKEDRFWRLLESAEIEFAPPALYVETWHATIYKYSRQILIQDYVKSFASRCLVLRLEKYHRAKSIEGERKRLSTRKNPAACYIFVHFLASSLVTQLTGRQQSQLLD